MKATNEKGTLYKIKKNKRLKGSKVVVWDHLGDEQIALTISKKLRWMLYCPPESMKRDLIISNILERQKQNNLSSSNKIVKIFKKCFCYEEN